MQGNNLTVKLDELKRELKENWNNETELELVNLDLQSLKVEVLDFTLFIDEVETTTQERIKELNIGDD